MKNTNKRSFSLGTVVGWLLVGVAVVYAAATLFTRGNSYTKHVDKSDVFKLEDSNPFQEGDVGLTPGESMSFSPSTTAYATTDMYVFEKIMMPTFTKLSGETGSLYTVTLPGWREAASYGENGKWVEVLVYENPLTSGSSVPESEGKITMVDMGIDVYAGLQNLNVEATAYGLSTDQDLDSAWNAIREEFD